MIKYCKIIMSIIQLAQCYHNEYIEHDVKNCFLYIIKLCPICTKYKLMLTKGKPCSKKHEQIIHNI